jgi:drug/metabolite transporter (DMT)-like permease
VDRTLIGELAALATAACWAGTTVFFTLAGQRVGSNVVNLSRLALALAIMVTLNRLTGGEWLPLSAGGERWAYLGISGVIGFALGDAALLQALLSLGPRLATLMMSLVPIITTVIAWVAFNEHLAPVDLAAVALTVGGVAWVVLERRPQEARAAPRGRFAWGLAFGVIAALGQAVGLILSREGMRGDYPVIPANVIRILAGGAALWAFALATGRAGHPWQAVREHPRAAWAIAGGTLVGPVTGVMFSLLAVQLAPVGIASTLMALTPIMVLPLTATIFKERVSARALFGTVLAIVGVGLIFLF